MNLFNRRSAMKCLAAGASLVGGARNLLAAAADQAATEITPSFTSDWQNTHDRVWLGADYWANPMEDWMVREGRAECTSRGGNRSVHLLTHQLTDPSRPFSMSVRLGIAEPESEKTDAASQRAAAQGLKTSAGFRVGVKSELNEYRSNCFAGGGINAGLSNGKLILGKQSQPLQGAANLQDIRLTLHGQPSGERYALTLTARDGASDAPLGSLTHTVQSTAVLGNVGIVNNYDPRIRNESGARFWFAELSAGGDAFTVSPEQRFGPLLWSMYSLSDSRSAEGFVMKISALTPPLGEADNPQVELEVQRSGRWESLGEASLHQDAWTTTFRIANWDETTATPYRLIYRERRKDGSTKPSEWQGTIRANPSDRPVVVGGLTCQHESGFPYAPVAENLKKLDPDLLFFSGDQLYESHGGFGVIREPAGPAILNYLRKYYMFGWVFGDVMRDRPTLCIPDDHDVFHGNIWGEAGAPMKEGTTSSSGGYIQPIQMVQVVHATNTAHHPDLFDPTPIKQGMSVYYGDMVYGRVSFAIIGDRQFKSGPERVETGGGRADHVSDPNFDTSALDKPGLELLGERQEQFLEHWVADWRGADMKVLLSETVFAGVATHHGSYDGYLKADLDSGSWPQTARNRAVRIMRKGFPLHINGDQHLTTLVQYGADEPRDGSWSFCPPAISVGYPRWWRPDEVNMPHTHRPEHGMPNTGQYVDGFGNYAYVYAVGNPEVATEENRYDRAHQKGSGFGIITIDTEARTYTCDSYRFLVDATAGKPSDQFPGWPLTLQQTDNYGRRRVGYLQERSAEGDVEAPVVKVFDAAGELVYAIRVQGRSFKPFVFEEGTYTVTIGDPDTDVWKSYENQTIQTR